MGNAFIYASTKDAKIEAEELQHIDLGPYGVIVHEYSKNRAPTLIETDEFLVFSPESNIKLDGSSGRDALNKLVMAYKIDGEDAFSSIHNSFSVILINKQDNRITAAIDKFGISKLFYTCQNKHSYLANSLSLMSDVLTDCITLSHQAIYHYIDAHIIPSPLTIYEGIYKCEPSQSISINGGNISRTIYWEPTFNEETPGDIQSLQDSTLEALRNAVKKCGINDSTGAFLSGGLDSSTVAGLMATNNPDRKVSTYTMGFAEAGYDETEYAEEAANHFGTNLRHYYVTPDDVASAFNDVISNCDEPFGNSSIIPAYLCARFAHDEGIETMLAGDGGDELFAGNERYTKQNIFEYYKMVPSLLRKGILEPVFLNSLSYTKLPPFSKVRSYIEQATTPMPDRMEKYNFIHHFGANAIFNEGFLDNINTSLPLDQKREVYNRPKDATMLNRMLYLDWKITLADNDLVKVNTACNLAGVDVCYPMLDEQVVHISTMITTPLKMRNGHHLRSFYKDSLTGFLPEKIINKSKHGFGLPFGEWLKKSAILQERIYRNLDKLKNRGYIKTEFIDQIIEIHKSDNAASFYGTMVWILAVLEEWLESRKL